MRRTLLVLLVSVTGSAWTVCLIEACGHSDDGASPTPNSGPNVNVSGGYDGGANLPQPLPVNDASPDVAPHDRGDADTSDDASPDGETVPTFGRCPTDGGGCGDGRECAYLISSGCHAVPTCIASVVVTCLNPVVACGCDNSEVTLGCGNLPTGWAERAVASAGVCGITPVAEAGIAPHKFTCGTAQCTAPTQFCKTQQSAGALPTYTCADIPSQCTGPTACQCVEAQTGAQDCNSINGEMTATVR
jgi:hypothetical protein